MHTFLVSFKKERKIAKFQNLEMTKDTTGLRVSSCSRIKLDSGAAGGFLLVSLKHSEVPGIQHSLFTQYEIQYESISFCSKIRILILQNYLMKSRRLVKKPIQILLQLLMMSMAQRIKLNISKQSMRISLTKKMKFKMIFKKRKNVIVHCGPGQNCH